MKSEFKRKWVLFIDFFVMFLLIALDQYTKYLAVVNLKDRPAIPVIEGVFELNYLENRGAAFGMLQNQKVFFIFIACIILVAIFYVLFKIPKDRKYIWLHILLVLIASGAVGNMIDRVRLEYVVDFLYFVLINFPIFNVADIYVSVACVLLAVVILFYYKEQDLEFLSIRQKKGRENG
ncbi:MAG: signal peptidase II [Lachnospiraceae bacterium]|nr:signal peptidase II [Lachnospiraceae bacterium]MDD7027121.1 signal peptidase II [Lachnospiraceae bacterium]MDY5700168.1 signal peptidase II [Lachnospiraceae bacterium]